MKHLLTLLLLTISTSATASCITATESVKDNEAFLWSLKLNTVKVSDADYAKAYSNYLVSVKVAKQACSVSN